MNKDLGGSDQQATTPSLFSAAVNKFARMGSNRSLSPSASGKYRVSSFLAATGMGVTTSSTSPSMQAHVAVPTSPVAKKLQDLVRQTSMRGSRHSFKFSDAAVNGSFTDRGSQETAPNASPTRGKLPQKIRASVTRMRSQLSLTTNNDGSPTKARQRHSTFGVGVSSSPIATAAPNRRRVSRQPQEIGNQPRASIRDEASQLNAVTPSDAVRLPSNNSDPSFVLRFMELLRPLQSSMTSLREAGGISDDDDDSDDGEDEAEAIFRQHERESSRILRICCSLDNLLFAITDQVQEHNNDLLAIARGPAHELVKLILNGIRQIVAAMAPTPSNGEQAGSNGMPSLTAKEERYLRDFLVEIADRWSELDDLLRGIYLWSLETVKKELSELQTLYADLKAEKQALELEIIDIREFNSNQSSATMAVTSNFMRLANQSKSQHPESNEQDMRTEEEHLAGYELKENPEGGGEQRTAAEEVEMLKKQCEEYGRLLEMAKQEIRLSHQERQSQHVRLMELSQTLLKDEEVAQLRNELQSEKKRVKRLEMESISLRETEMDLNMKIQSLQLNQPAGNATGAVSSKANVNSRSVSASAATASPYLRPRSGSAVLTPEGDGIAASIDSLTPPTTTTLEPDGADQKARSSEERVHDGPAGPLPSAPHGMSLVDTTMPWINRWIIVGDISSVNTDQEDDGLVRRFLADLLMTDQEYEAALAQSKLRKRANVPTTGAPPSSSGANNSSQPTKKKKPKQTGVPDPNGVAIPMNEWVEDAIVVAGVRQLIWVFYELYLMAEEAKRIDPHLGDRKQRCQTTNTPLASIVLHYFLERHVTESEAVLRLRRFVLVLSKLRFEFGDIRLFCEFLDGHRGREELNFYLWILQAIESVDLGVNYVAESSMAVPPARLGRYVCTLKALYVSRMVYHFLHVKSLKKPTLEIPVDASKRKQSMPLTAEPQPAASSPTKKRRKSRPNSASGMATPGVVHSTVAEVAATPNLAHVDSSVVAKAKQQYAHALAINSGYPLTLEAFNNVVQSFAETPSRDELLALLGGFYHPTGDERKVALDVFLVLLMELFSTQLHWRKTQLQALFVRLAKEEELATLLAAKKRQEEAEAAASQGKKGRASQPETKEKKKPKVSPSKKRQRRAGIDGSTDKYLRGLSRDRFRNFLVQGGLVVDAGDHDMDALYVAIFEVTDRTPSEIHFEDIYDALTKFEMLGNDSYAVDFSAWEVTNRATTHDLQRDLVRTVVSEWHELSRHVIVMTENDPNVFIRRCARRFLRRLTASNLKSSEIEALKVMRDFKALAWRVACYRQELRVDRREQLEWCLTELHHINQAIRTIYGVDNNLAKTAAQAATTKQPTQRHGDLSIFYDSRILTLVLSLSVDPTKSDTDKEMQTLQNVLQRYSLHIAHLFDSYSSARCSSNGITKDQWIVMAHDLGLICDRGLSVAVCESLFVTTASVAAGAEPTTRDEPTPDVAYKTTMRGGDSFELDRTGFVTLLVLVAVKRYDKIKHKRKALLGHTLAGRKTSAPSLAQIVEQFGREVLALKAFVHPSNTHEEDFHRKLANPLVGRVLLEHRAFLRHIFFQYAKHNHEHGDIAESSSTMPHGTDVALVVRQVKSKHNSMVLTQFIAFLRAFGLLETRDYSTTSQPNDAIGELRLDDVGAAYVFRAVMAVESDDHSQMEFDEFAASVAAIAALRNPHPFLLWHVKIDAFVHELRRRAPRAADDSLH